jgi:hypothetical protein
MYNACDLDLQVEQILILLAANHSLALDVSTSL